MGSVVLDASALLTLIYQETGHEVVMQHLAGAVMSTVNVSEAMAVLQKEGISVDEASHIVFDLISEIVDFNISQAMASAALRSQTKTHGLSLGDRACLALAQEKQLPVLTADRIWSQLNLSVQVMVLR